VTEAYCYLYAVVPGRKEGRLTGLRAGARHLYRVGKRGLMAVVHRGEPGEPFARTEEEAMERAWLHYRVVEELRRRYSSLLPLAAGQALAGQPPEETVRRWLEENEPWIRERLGFLRNKDEYRLEIRPEEEADPEIPEAEGGRSYLARRAAWLSCQEAREKRWKERAERWVALLGECGPVKAEKRPGELLAFCLLPRREAGEILGRLGEKAREERVELHWSGPRAPYAFARS
jgi:hypothetical protein